MRSCEEIEILMNLYLDDMLTSEERQTLEKHLEECSDCRAKLEELVAVKSVLGEMMEEPPANLHEQIMAFVERNTQKEKNVIPFYRKKWYRALTAVAACAILAVVAVQFMPRSAFSVPGNGQNCAVMDSVPAAPSVAPEAAPPTESAPEENDVPGNDVVSAPQANAESKDYSYSIEITGSAVPSVETMNGQMAEDLPPLRKENLCDNNEYRVSTVSKWLKVTGCRDALPDWVNLQFMYEAELDGISREYVEIADWAEEYWVDQLIACGFTVEVMEEQAVVEDGEHVLLVFFWE